MNRTETSSTTLYIPQMDCPQELGMIRAGFRGDEGIHSLQADYLARSLRVQYDPQLWTPDKIRDRVARTGLQVESVRVPVEDRWHDGWLDAAKDSPEMVVAIGLLAIATMESWANGSANTITALCAMIVCMAGPAIGFRAWQSLRLRHLDMHVLIVLATLGALLIGESLEAATLVVLFRLSLWIEQLSQRRAQRAIESLANLSPQWAHRLQGERNSTEDVSIEQLKMGDRILVRPGERLPTDGLVVLGGSSVDESHVTGEAMPVEKSIGSSVFGGTLCGEGTLTIEVTRVANDSMVSRIRQMLDEARSSQAPTEQFVERFARYYTPAVIAAAAATAIVPPLWTVLLSSGTASWDVTQFKTWFFRALVMLVVACPCALVIATPITVICGLYRGSRLGALIKGGAFLERLGQIRWIAFDKTGTVTEGKPVVVEVHPTGGITRDELLTLAATLESHSEHPIARAITRAAASGIDRVESFEVLRGFGVRGVVQGRRTTAASLRYVRDQFHDLLSPTLIAQLEEKTLGSSVVLVVREEIQDTLRPAMGDANPRHGRELLGWLILSDSLRPDAVLSMKKLRGLGVERMLLLTGDSSAAAQPIADQLGFDGVLADLLPDDKLRVVRELTLQQPHLAMVGDGVNDAPALTAAPLGIAMGEGASNVSQGSSDIVLMAADLERLVDLVRLGKQVRRVLRQNIILAIGMKLLALAFAVAGFASMWLAVAADMGASLLVIANGMRVLQIHDRRVGR